MPEIAEGDPYEPEPEPEPVPWIFILPVIEPVPQPPSFRCPKCGINFEGVMGYVCSDPCCPTQPRTW